MRNQKKVHSFSSDTWILCAWCREKQGYDLFRHPLHDHAKNVPCEGRDHAIAIFCSERHRQYFIHSTRSNGNLPPGYKKAVG